MKAQFTHQIKVTNPNGKQSTVRVSTTNSEPVSKIVIMYCTRNSLIINNTNTTLSTS